MFAAVAQFRPSLQPALAFLEGIGGMEMMLVAVIGLLLFGGKGLPDMARTLGRVVREFKKATANVEQEVKRVMEEEPAPPPPRRSPASPPSRPVRADLSAEALPPTPSVPPPPPSASSAPDTPRA